LDSDSYFSSLLQTDLHGVFLCPGIVLSLAFFLLLFFIVLAVSEEIFFSLTLNDVNNADNQTKRLFEQSDMLWTSIFIIKTIASLSFKLFFLIAYYLLFDVVSLWSFSLFFLAIAVIYFLLELAVYKIFAKKAASFFSPMLNITNKLCSPLSKRLLSFNFYVEKTLSKQKIKQSVKELSKTLDMSGSNTSEEKEILTEIIKFYDKTADEIMTSRLDIEDLDIKTGFRNVVDFVISSSYSRIPVYDESEDNIKGILYLKDLLPYLDKPDSFEWKTLIRPAYFVPETKKISDLLEEFRKHKVHMAVVVDEFGGTSGIVTMEDILEEIVGEISDEYDDDEQRYTRLADGSFIFEAKILLTDFFRAIGIDDSEFGELTDEVETLGGLIIEIKGSFPQKKEIIDYKNYRFKVLDIDDRRIIKVRFKRIPEVKKG